MIRSLEHLPGYDVAERSTRIAAVLLRLQDTTAQIRVRGAFMLLVAFAALAVVLGLETILGALKACKSRPG